MHPNKGFLTKTTKFQPSFDSLRTYECPLWFQDAKLGFWSHWDPPSNCQLHT